MRQKILLIGEGSRLARFEPLLRSVSVEAIRVPAAEPAVQMARELPVDLMVIALPPGGMSAEELVERVREPGSASRGAQVLVLGESESPEPGSSAGRGIQQLLPLDLDSPRSGEVLSRFLRKTPRAEARLMVRLEQRSPGGSALRILQIQDLSRGGMLVRAAERLPLGTEVRFELALPSGEAIEGRAKVVRHAEAETDRMTGMGLCYSHLDEESEERLRLFLAERLRREEEIVGPE